jgi:pimeloyl-ACP methyl ester carboxylesterase
VSDLEAVIDAAGITEPITLLGMSQGGATCLSYALKHPDRVSRLILYGAYACGIAEIPPLSRNTTRCWT